MGDRDQLTFFGIPLGRTLTEEEQAASNLPHDAAAKRFAKSASKLGAKALFGSFPLLNEFIDFAFQDQKKVRTQNTRITSTHTIFQQRSMSRFRNAMTGRKPRGGRKRLASLRRRNGRLRSTISRGQQSIRNNGLNGLNHPKEVKTYDIQLAQFDVTSLSGGFANTFLEPLTDIKEGTGDDERIGRIVKAVRLLWTLSIELPKSTDLTLIADSLRFIILIDHAKVKDGNPPETNEVLQDFNTQSMYDKDTKPRFTILFDRVYTMANEDKNIAVIDGGTIGLNGLTCAYGGPLGNVNDMGADNLWVLCQSQLLSGVNFAGQFKLSVGTGKVKIGTRFEYVG